jgi:predicted glycosyl hydrolase (DUF1957 family)
MIHNHAAEDYARSRIEEHYANFMKLSGLLHQRRTHSRVLESLEKRNNIFPWMNAALYRHLVKS